MGVVRIWRKLGWGWMNGLPGRLPEEGRIVSRDSKAVSASVYDFGNRFHTQWGLQVSWSARDYEGKKGS